MADAPGSGNEHKIISFANAFKRNGDDLYFYDIDAEKSQYAADIWDGECIDGLSDVYNEGIDIVVITTPDDTHYETLMEVCKLNPRVVICEKPLCNHPEQVKEIVSLYNQKRIPLVVNFTRRFLPKYRKLKNDYKQGYVGKLLYARCVFNRGIEHTGSHAIDTFNWFFKDDFSKVELIESDIEDYRVWDLMMIFEKYTFCERRIGNMPVPAYFNQATKHVVDNVTAFLQGTQPLFSVGQYSIEGADKLCLIRGKQKQY